MCSKTVTLAICEQYLASLVSGETGAHVFFLVLNVQLFGDPCS